MKSIIVAVIACALMGYLIGCINLSYFISKMHGFDIREHGSGNAGASNVVITMGKKAGAFVALFDIFKAFFAVKVSFMLFPQFFLIGVVTSVATILGHIFPFYMGFKGGKGFASLGGSILALDYRVFIVLLICTIFVVFLTDYICFGPTSVSIVFPIVYGYMNHNYMATLIFFVASVAICYRHRENFMRIKEGTELRFSFLWNRKAEAERFGVENDDGETFPFELEEERKKNNSKL